MSLNPKTEARRVHGIDSSPAATAPIENPVASASIPSKRRRFLPIDLPSVGVSGEFGRRMCLMIESNILEIDIDRTFLEVFRERGEGGYFGFGKFIDAVVRLGAGTRDQRLITLKDKAIAALLQTQEVDGYIGTIKDPQMRIKAMWDLHEGAYLIWAFLSDHHFFGKRESLTAAQRLADYFLARFEADPELRPDAIIYSMPFEISRIGLDRALLALSRATGLKKYREFVTDFLKLQQYDPSTDCGATTTENHAYTCLATCIAQVELYDELGRVDLLRGSRKLISFLREGDALLVTGSCSHWECWHDTQLGLESSSETCASAYLARFMDTMLQLDGNSLYGDIMERDIYNALFAATSPDGRQSRYHTPFDGKRFYDPHGYQMCCANNNKRFLADLRGWMYYRAESGVVVNLYNASTVQVRISPDTVVRIEQQTDYPTSGAVRLTVDPSSACRFEVKLRIPRWCEQATIRVNGSEPLTAPGGQFYGIDRQWHAGDAIELEMPMEWRFVRGRRAQVGRAAILRGPVLFTFNPANNEEISAPDDLAPRLLKINPREVAPPVPHTAVRPDGISCVIKAWPPSPHTDYPYVIAPTERKTIVLSEYPDPNGRGIYFMVPGEGRSLLVDDELICLLGELSTGAALKAPLHEKRSPGLPTADVQAHG